MKLPNTYNASLHNMTNAMLENDFLEKTAE